MQLSVHSFYTSACCSLLIPCTSWKSSSINFSYLCLLLSLHPLHSLAVQPLRLLLLPVFAGSLLNPCTLCSLLLPVFAAFSSSTALSRSTALCSLLLLSVHSSYQYLLLSPHPLHSLTAQLFCSLLPPVFATLSSSTALSRSTALCSLILPVFAALSSCNSLFTPYIPVLAALSSSLAVPEIPCLLC